MEKQEFIKKVKSGAVNGLKKHGVLASLTIAQAILESGWGTSDLSKKANNLFGIKATGNEKYVTMPTKEYVNGQWITVNAKFRKYDSWNDSVEDHSEFLVKNKRYKNIINNKNYKEVCKLIQQDGYATDPNYSTLLINLIEKNKLNSYDKTPSTNPTPSPSPTTNANIMAGQKYINKFFGFGIKADGIMGPETKKAGIKVLQKCLNLDYKAGLTVDGVFGNASKKALGNHYVKKGEKQYMVTAAEILLMLKKYSTNGAEFPGQFGDGLEKAVNKFKTKKNLNANGVCDSSTFTLLIK